MQLVHHHNAGWGSNTFGQLGDGSGTDKNVPTAVSGGGVWYQISGGDAHTCGVKSDGSAWCEFSLVLTVVCTHTNANVFLSRDVSFRLGLEYLWPAGRRL